MVLLEPSSDTGGCGQDVSDVT